MVNVGIHATLEQVINSVGATTEAKPRKDFIFTKKAKLLLEVKLEKKNRQCFRLISDSAPTSGSVRDLPIAIIPEVKIPSVNIGPKKFCILGVSRKGTTSVVANNGRFPDMPEETIVRSNI
jgi:hypothetical protein